MVKILSYIHRFVTDVILNMLKYRDHTVLLCINICRVPMKVFEHEADRLSAQTSPEEPGKC